MRNVTHLKSLQHTAPHIPFRKRLWQALSFWFFFLDGPSLSRQYQKGCDFSSFFCARTFTVWVMCVVDGKRLTYMCCAIKRGVRSGHVTLCCSVFCTVLLRVASYTDACPTCSCFIFLFCLKEKGINHASRGYDCFFWSGDPSPSRKINFFFFSLVGKTQANHWTKRMVSTRLTT